MMLFLLLFAAALAPPPPGSPSITIEDLAKGNCSISVVTVGDDALSSRFNGAVIDATKDREAAFCRRTMGNYVIYTNSNVRPTDRSTDHFQYHLSLYEAHDFMAGYDSGSRRGLASEEKECRGAAPSCAQEAVDNLLTTLEAR